MKDKTNLTGLNPDNFRSVINGKDTGLYILRNGSGMEMCVTNYGAIVLSIMAPDSHGKFENVVIGFDTLEEARRQSKDYYIGATIGPVAGRILHGAFRVGEKDYHLQLNSVSNTLHSGDNGFHTVVWEAQQPCENQLLLRHFHADGEAGFPGNVTVRMMYTLTDDNGFRIDYEAETDRDTLFCPTNHAYFNLAGMGTPTTSIEDHLVRINADFYLPIDMNTNNTGEVRAVGDTPFDFRDYHSIGERINRKDLQLLNGHGYDHCFVLKKPALHELSSPPPASVRPVGAEWISIPQSRGLSCTPAIICRASRACMALCIRVVAPSALKPSAFPIHRTIRISPPSYYVKETFINRHVFINSVRNHEKQNHSLFGMPAGIPPAPGTSQYQPAAFVQS